MMLSKNINRLPAKSNLLLGTEVGYSLKQVAAMIEEVTHLETKINWGGKPYRNSDIMYAVADISTAINMLKWKPKLSLNEGVIKYFNSKI